MSVTLDSLLGLPSMGRFAERLRLALEDRHVVLAYGGTVPESWMHGLLEECLGRIDFCSVRTSEREPGESIPCMLAKVSDTPEFALTPGCREDASPNQRSVLWLQELDQLPPATKQEWMSFVASAARLDWPARTRLLLPMRRAPAADTDSRLALLHLWSEVSRVELTLLCHEAGRDGDLLESLWREAILPEVCGGDLELVGALWHPVIESEQQTLAALSQVAQQRGWSDQLRLEVTAARRLVGQRSEILVPAHWRTLWEEGMAHGLRNDGMEVSAAALAWSRDEGDHRELRHRVWRGQARLVLPLLDDIRIRSCEAMTERHGRDWPTRFLQFEDAEAEERARKDPRSVDFGPLAKATRSPFSKADRFRDVVSLGCFLRNELAHYRPITFQSFKRLVNQEATSFV